ncbi:hypothetical protein GQB51_004466 [Salmonella enterica]|nr:hypothetical protein [Salmonella enterica]
MKMTLFMSANIAHFSGHGSTASCISLHFTVSRTGGKKTGRNGTPFGQASFLPTSTDAFFNNAVSK